MRKLLNFEVLSKKCIVSIYNSIFKQLNSESKEKSERYKERSDNQYCKPNIRVEAQQLININRKYSRYYHKSNHRCKKSVYFVYLNLFHRRLFTNSRWCRLCCRSCNQTPAPIYYRTTWCHPELTLRSGSTATCVVTLNRLVTRLNNSIYTSSKYFAGCYIAKFVLEYSTWKIVKRTASCLHVTTCRR